MDVSLNIPKATRPMKTTNIALKTTIKILPKMKKKIEIFEISWVFKGIFEISWVFLKITNFDMDKYF